MEPNSPLLVSPEAVAQSLERSAMQSASQDAGGMRGIGRAIVEGVADNTPLGRVFLRPLNSITTDTERAQQFQKSEQLVRLYQQAAALRAIPMEQERMRLGLEADRLGVEAAKQRQEINAQALKTGAVEHERQTFALGQDKAAARRQIIADAEKRSERMAIEALSTALAGAEAGQSVGPDGKPVQTPMAKLTDEERRELLTGAHMEPLRDVFTVGNLWFSGNREAAIDYARSRGANITDRNGDMLTIRSPDGQEHDITIELFDSVAQQAQQMAANEIGARYRMVQASKSFGHSLKAATMRQLIAGGYAKGATDAEQMVGPIFDSLTPPAVESLGNLEAMNRLLSEKTTTLEKQEAMAWLAPLQEELQRSGVEVTPTSDGGAVLFNKRTGHAETLRDYVAAMSAANDTIQQVREFMASVEAGRKATQTLAAQDRKTKREENVVMVDDDGIPQTPEVPVTEQSLLDHAKGVGTNPEPTGAGQMSADQLFDSLGIPKAKGRK